MVENLKIALIFILWLIGVVLIMQYAFRWVFTYKLGKTGIEIYLFGLIPLRQVRYDNIAKIEKLNTKETYKILLIFPISTLRFGIKLWGAFVFIRQKKAFIHKRILVTPGKADEFIAEVKKHLPEHTITEY